MDKQLLRYFSELTAENLADQDNSAIKINKELLNKFDDDQFLRYFADLTVENLVNQDNSAIKINKELLNKFDSYPIIDFLRTAAKDNPAGYKLVTILLDQPVEKDPEIILGINLARNFIPENKILLDKIENLFHNPKASSAIKFSAIFRLLDSYSDVKRNQSYLDYIINFWGNFLEIIPQWTLNNDSLIVAEKRIIDKSFPKHKQWIYILISLKSVQIEKTHQLLENAKNNMDLSIYKKMLAFIDDYQK